MKTRIYGAGTYGTLTKKILEAKGISIDFFVDKKLAGNVIEGIDVLHPDMIPYGCEDTIYIAVKNYYAEIKKYLTDNGCTRIRDIVELLEYDVSKLTLTQKENDAWKQRKTFEIAVKMDELDGIKFPHVEMVVSERCTLKCRDCSSLIPYYKNPGNIDVSQMIKWLDTLLSYVSYIGELRLLGGEPFLNENIGDLITGVNGNPKIGMISVYTNGMIVPEEKVWDILQEYNVAIHISDYGIGKKTRNRFIEICKERQLDFFARRYDSWYDMGVPQRSNLNDEDIKKIFMYCASAACPTILNGKFYQCPRAAHADNIGLVKSPEVEYANLDGKNAKDSNAIKNIAEKSTPILMCKYCYGTNSNIVEAAVQIK